MSNCAFASCFQMLRQLQRLGGGAGEYLCETNTQLGQKVFAGGDVHLTLNFHRSDALGAV
jgi:hypothetical protein